MSRKKRIKLQKTFTNILIYKNPAEEKKEILIFFFILVKILIMGSMLDSS